jgi:hypothetical protein
LKVNFHDQFLEGWAGVIPPGYSAAMTNIIVLPDNIIRKGQVEGIRKGDIRGQVRFVESLFKVAA